MIKLRNKIALVIIFFFCCPYFVFSQGKINAPPKECLGNVTNFSYTAPAGLTLSSASWNFGDGFTSASLTPIHIYAAKGKYTVYIQATFTNSTTATDSFKLEVFGLPKAAFYYDLKNDTCLTRNKICYTDTSRPAVPGQTITNRLFVWGDGSFNQASSPPFGQKICHNYAIPDKYTLRMELTDIHGCKNSVSEVVNIAENIEPLFSIKKFEFLDCGSLRVCFKNESNPYNLNTAHYEWLLDTFAKDTFPYFFAFKCVPFYKSKTIIARLIAHAGNNCIDTYSRSIDVVIDSLPAKLEFLDTIVCYSDNSINEAWFKPVTNDTIYWYIDNAYQPFKNGSLVHFGTQMFPGVHQIKAEIVRGNCITPVTGNFTVLGPLAQIRVIDGVQCFSNREVFFADYSKGINRDHCIFNWTIMDSSGDQCTSNRTKDINKYRNCNYSVDWYTRHKFNNAVKNSYMVSFFIQDTISGCIDSLDYQIDMKNCSSMLDKDSIVHCQGALFLENIPPPFPIEFTIDSANQLWNPFPSLIDVPLLGTYTTGLRFKTIVSPWAENFGDDSIKVHTDSITYYDTIYLKDYLHVKPKKDDSIWYVFNNNCSPFKLSVHFKSGMFYEGDSINISWGDGTPDHEMKFTSTVKIDSISHFYKEPGIFDNLIVTLQNNLPCSTRHIFPIEKGKILSMYRPPLTCLNKSICFGPYVYDARIGATWSKITPSRKISWWFDDTSGTIDKFDACYRFKSDKNHAYKMIVTDTFGCLDTIVDTIFVQNVRANVKSNAMYVYCSELKHFFDSTSFHLTPFIPPDSIQEYHWQFGSGVFSSLQKNPLQSLNTSLDKIPAAHAVKMLYGCVDTFRFEINIIGPKPYFTIRDTIGCGSLNAHFINSSKNCKQYIWQYGDSAQTSYQTFSKQPVNYLYTKPGRYHISLVGIDTVFNPFTNSYQYCSSTFPDKIFQKDTTRSVLVLPYYKTGIISKDTVCLGSTINFFSKSDTAYDYDYWQMGDASAAFKLNAGSTHNYQYTKAGLYAVKLNPGYNTTLNNQCRDSAQKNILVLDVKADFDIDPLNVPPVFLFHNKSSPANASLRWDFGQSGSSSNTSSDQDPSHDYGMHTGTFTVCLIADLPEGCSDTICKTVFNDHKESFGIYNVFTPGNIDGKNDQYDIQIENEDLYDLQIYDRWGNLVYEGKEDADNTQNINWNGKVLNKGAECPAATYYYIFRYSLKQKPGEVITLNGIIMLIR